MTCRELIRSCTLFATILSISILLPACNQQKGNGKKTVAFVTNGVDPFWVIAQRGAEKAGEDLDVNVEVRMPPQGVADQKRMVQELLAQNVDGIAISPIDPENQNELLKEIAERSILITQDSDAPESPRQCYIGMDNYTAGRMCGELVKEALPDGGEVMLFVGRLGQANARQRRQGVIDELMDRSHDGSRYDEPGEVIKNDKYSILDTRTDDFDHPQAKANAEDAIANHPNLKCMVGLFAYNPPLCLEAIRDAGKLKEIKVVSFDENEASLQGIMDGTVVGTVVQNPYQYGYESVRVLKALANGDKSVIPENEILHIPARKIRKDNVEEFWTELKSLLGDSAKKDQGQPASETTKSAKKTDPGATPDPRYPQQQKEPQKDE
ncbi:sugar-binding protein [Gimesia chilikensis]|uniref:D-ribose-binding periplasmic protein n=1 Tax=Gimesia chilikensis TaxID=2605989 RepID=A0A517PRZ2_9PLAN|nr:sugar-binding protein [Gimesia chilikensis]QDT22145.1 D-ribose-binding periplasmic protein precursor [Gimesia chilikensis]